MKVITKIHRLSSNALLVVLLSLTPFVATAQCPKGIICDPIRGLGLQFDVLPSTTNAANTLLDFGATDSRTGYYQGTVSSVDKTFFYAVPCTNGLNNLKITFNDRNHTYCGASNSCYDYVFYQNGAFFKTLLDSKGLVADPSGCNKWEGDCGTGGTIYRSGSVGIGTNYGGAYLLSVAGKILTEQYKVQQKLCYVNYNMVWCDYVFDDTYKLMPLEQVEKIIQQNKHLPKTKSADEIKKEGGIDAAETLLNHQEKIEEIFLHLIELDKQLSSSNDN
jgi:hypothetical protein